MGLGLEIVGLGVEIVGLGIRGWTRVCLGICKVGGVGSGSNIAPGSCVTIPLHESRAHS